MIKHIKKFFLDIFSTCYEDSNFQVMSLPRLAFFTSICMFVSAWIAEQFFGRPFEHFDSLVAAIGACGASYVGKKFIDRGGNP